MERVPAERPAIMERHIAYLTETGAGRRADADGSPPRRRADGGRLRRHSRYTWLSHREQGLSGARSVGAWAVLGPNVGTVQYERAVTRTHVRAVEEIRDLPNPGRLTPEGLRFSALRDAPLCGFSSGFCPA